MVKKKETVFLSEGYYNETVKRVVEENPWLLHMDYVDLNTEGQLPICWNGTECNYDSGNLCVMFEDLYGTYLLYSVNIEGKPDTLPLYMRRNVNRLVPYFKDWTKPTEQEKDYFEMIYGVRIPWSEEQPLVIDESLGVYPISEDYYDDED